LHDGICKILLMDFEQAKNKGLKKSINYLIFFFEVALVDTC